MSARVKSRSFSPAFANISQIVAIGEIRDRRQTLQMLILACAAELSAGELSTGERAATALDSLYGLKVPDAIAQEALVALMQSGDLVEANGALSLKPEVADEIRSRTRRAAALEDKVRDEWLSLIEQSDPQLSSGFLWSALKAYLFRAFRRHGIQAAALLDPSIEGAPEYTEGLSLLLEEAVADHVPEEHRVAASAAISGFLATLSESRSRSEYIAQLADGAFSYFSLTVSPEAAASLASELRPLKLFLDTNFLFGLLKLGDHFSADLSDELVELATSTGLPFSLEYHERTDREVNASISHYQSYLGSRVWSNGIARAAVGSRYLPGIVRQYLTEYLRTGMDVGTFFRPYRHPDELLRSREIALFRSEGDRQEERATVLAEYTAFLEARGIRKRHNVREHDATLLDAVRHLRSQTTNTLEAGALLLTYDYNLYRFDWESRRQSGALPVVVLPNIFWQIVRPFVQPGEDFDRSFAETFALPEFRALGSDSAEASSRMLAILASYEGVPESTARRMLSNDLLLDRLKRQQDEGSFGATVKDALIEENRSLAEEIEELRRASEEARKGAERYQREAVEGRDRIAALEGAVGGLRSLLADMPSAEELATARDEANRERARADAEADAKLEGNRARDAGAVELKKLQARWKRVLDGGAVALGFLAATLVVWLLSRSHWVVSHERSLALRGLAGLATASLVVASLRPRVRRTLLVGSGGVLVLLGLLAANL